MLNRDKLLNTYLNTINENRKDAIIAAKQKYENNCDQLWDEYEQVNKDVIKQLKSENLFEIMETNGGSTFKDFIQSEGDGGVSSFCLVIGKLCKSVDGYCTKDDIKNYKNNEKIMSNPIVVKLCEIAVKYIDKIQQIRSAWDELNQTNPTEGIVDPDTGFDDYFGQRLYINDVILMCNSNTFYYGVVTDSNENGIKIRFRLKNDVRTYVDTINENHILKSIVRVEGLDIDRSLFEDLKIKVDL